MTDPLAAKLAAALFDAKIPCDYGEDVDRLIAAMAAHGVTLAAPAEPTLREAAQAVLDAWDKGIGGLGGERTRMAALRAALAEGLRKWVSPAAARRAEIASNAELRRAATAYLALLDTDQGDDNSGQMLEWATAEDRLREALRAALEGADR